MESPKSLYQLSLEKVVHRLNCLCHYIREGRSLDLESLSDQTPLLDQPSYVMKYCCSQHRDADHAQRGVVLADGDHNQIHHPNNNNNNLANRLHHHHHHHHHRDIDGLAHPNAPHEANHHHHHHHLADEEEDDRELEGALGTNKDALGPSRHLGEEFANRLLHNHGYDEKLKKMKKSYHAFVNTFIFGTGSSKKPPMVPGASGTFSASGSTSGSSTSLGETSEQEKLANSYRITTGLVEDIFQTFQKKYPISDRVLKLAIFQGSINRLMRIRIDDASQLSSLGLKMMSEHGISKLEISHLSKCTVNELIQCLSPWSCKNLQVLAVRFCSFSRFNKVCIVLSLTSLSNLTSLDVSYTDFNNHGLEIVTEDLPRLQSLNISSTKVNVLAPLAKTAHRMTAFYAHNVSASCRDEGTIASLKLLRILDVSDSRSYLDQGESLNEVFRKLAAFDALIELDISGRTNVEYTEVEQLVLAKQSNQKGEPLRFLGLLETNLNYDDMNNLMRISKENLILTGNGSLTHIIEAIKRYKDCSVFVQKSLLHLYSSRFQLETQEMYDHRSEILNLIIDLLHAYLGTVNIVLVSTACLYIFTQMIFTNVTGVTPTLHPHLLSKVVQINMITMDKYSTNQPVMKNILLTLCSDRILQEIAFDRMACMQLVMDSLLTFQEPTLNRLALAVCSILAAKIPTEQTTLIGQQLKYMNRLLEFVQRKNVTLDAENRDVLFKLALSALWNFTDESPMTCQTFIEHGGLQLYIEALEQFNGQNSVETKILGLINNIAEVPYLRPHLLDINLLSNLKKLIHSEHIDISYFSAGILAQLGSDSTLNWKALEGFELEDVLYEMKQVILSWKTPNFEMVAYRSFLPFIALLTCFQHSAVQLWALWAIHHVCTKSGSQKYCQMLHDEHCLKLIAQILDQKLRNAYQLDKAHHRAFIGTRLFTTAQIEAESGHLVEEGQAQAQGETVDEAIRDTVQRAHYLGLRDEPEQIRPECSQRDVSFLTGSCRSIPDITQIIADETDRGEAVAQAASNRLSLLSCDCQLRQYLQADPFLALPALILKTFKGNFPRMNLKDILAS